MTTEGKPKKRFIVSIVGLLLVILGVVWITAIFPAIDKVPLDYEQTYVFLGNLTTVDPDAQSTDSFPIKLTLDQEAIGTEDGALLALDTETGTRPYNSPRLGRERMPRVLRVRVRRCLASASSAPWARGDCKAGVSRSKSARPCRRSAATELKSSPMYFCSII